MKKILFVLVALISIAFVTTVFAQKMDDTANVAQKIAKGKQGKFAGEVVSVDPAAKSAVIKGKFGEKTAKLDYAKYKGGYKAAEDLKPGDKIAGTWQEVDGTIYITGIMKASDKKPEKPVAAPAPVH
jgi:hypothetical protein